MIYEWNVLRTVACLSVVLLHATTNTAIVNGDVHNDYYQFFRLVLCFATPTFILLSIIILAKRYPANLPVFFLWRRCQYIFIPFLCFATFYASNATLRYDENFGYMLYRHIVLGDFSGWFVLTIFQFYMLFFIIRKYQLSSVWFVPIFGTLGILYSLFISAFPVLNDAVSRWLLIGWLPYFAIAYIWGTHYTWLAVKLVHYRLATLIWCILSIAILAISYHMGLTAITSRRLDMILLVLAITCCILAYGQLLPKLPIIQIISSYSFGIFLLHWLIQDYLAPYTALLPSTVLQVLVLFISSLLLCIICLNILARLPYSYYLIGKLPKQKTAKSN
ncbi:acyltransferase family protein [Lysinibacillus piscis]|uniref:Membrane-bound acyltransferase YfiQ n=1 Tax=Lysinibacillus piscis TaxID=2518931 RepID=A0ABQ5NFS9_9BACI|nr:acyltransferase family protein [Lysinibacillus sp. KH24]GLC87251.1 putative membrane-bound acyltransferase YfiQ [Lysinibacillus sp. KH24]